MLKTPEANRLISEARLPELPNGEMKWTKVSNGKLDAYRRVVDVFFDSAQMRDVHFHALAVDTQKLNDKAFNEGSREIGFNKEIYQIAAKCARLYPGVFHVYPDYRDTNQKPEDLRLILNRGRAKTGDPRDWPFRRCQFRDSKKTLLIQVADLFIGAVAYNINGHANGESASGAKKALSEHVLHRARIRDPLRDTAMSGKFTLWHRQLK